MDVDTTAHWYVISELQDILEASFLLIRRLQRRYPSHFFMHLQLGLMCSEYILDILCNRAGRHLKIQNRLFRLHTVFENY